MVMTVRLDGDFSNINKNILKEVKNKIKMVGPKLVKKIKPKVQEVVIDSIKASSAYESMARGQLKAELGLPDISLIDNVIQTWARNVSVIFDHKKGELGAISIGIINEDYSDVLTLPEAGITLKNGRVFEWLRTLLLEGTRRVIHTYEFKFGSGEGRSNLGFMVKSPDGAWGVHPKFAGTADDNFATRAINEVFDSTLLLNILQSELKGLI